MSPTLTRRLVMLRWHLRQHARAAGIAWRLLVSRTTEDDAYHLRRAAEDADGFYPLEGFSRADVFEQLVERYGDDPRFLAWARRACERVANKWSGTGDIASAAQDWAHDLVAEYAADAGAELSDSWDPHREAA